MNTKIDNKTVEENLIGVLGELIIRSECNITFITNNIMFLFPTSNMQEATKVVLTDIDSLKSVRSMLQLNESMRQQTEKELPSEGDACECLNCKLWNS